jgi:hypothetical protein
MKTLIVSRNSSGRQRLWRTSVSRLTLAALGITGLMLLASGCGGSSGEGVAQVGTTSTNSSGSSSSGDRSSGDPVAYSACMRKNGVENFPDPDAQGRIKITSGRSASGRTWGVDANSATFKKALQACRRLLPNGGEPDPQVHEREFQAMLRFSACMRKNGVPNYPDPEEGPNGGTLMAMPRDIDKSPNFKTAKQACAKYTGGGGIDADESGEFPPPGAEAP